MKKRTCIILSKIIDFVQLQTIQKVLNSIMGLKLHTVNLLCIKVGIVSHQLKLIYLPNYKLTHMFNFINCEGTASTEYFESRMVMIKYLQSIKTVKSKRLEKGLPLNGQRTRSNSETCRKRRIKKETKDL